MDRKKINNRREFLKEVSKVGALTAVGISIPVTQVFANESKNIENSNSAHIFLTPPYLQNLTPSSVDIMFITNNNAYSWVQFGEKKASIKVHSEADGFIKAYNRLNCISLTGLKANTEYKYKIVSKEIVLFHPYNLKFGSTIETEEFTFKTASKIEEEISCVIFNDIHDRPSSFRDLLDANANKPFNLAILNGDMFDHQEDESQIINNLLTPLTSLFAKNVPFLMMRGNHETRGKFRRELKDYFSYPSDEYYFNFNFGPVHWTILDTGEDKPDNDAEYGGIVSFDDFRIKQAAWLEEEMQKPAYKQATYKVVMMHIPPYYSGDWHGTLHCREVFSSLFNKYKVDLVIAGHTHRYGIHPPTKEHSYPIIIGGGPKKGDRTIINFTANAQKLTVNIVDDMGKEVGDYVIETKK